MIRVLSLGAGVQSTTLALLAACGEVAPGPDCAIFADTGEEPAGIYRHPDVPCARRSRLGGLWQALNQDAVGRRNSCRLGTLPPADRFALEFTERRERIGAMLLGLPPRGLDQERWLALTRVFFVDGTEPFVESKALAMMRRFVRTWVPRTRALIAYADPSQGHEGTIYAADGWAPFGLTKLDRTGFRSRPGRTGEAQPSRKLRWVRTP